MNANDYITSTPNAGRTRYECNLCKWSTTQEAGRIAAEDHAQAHAAIAEAPATTANFLAHAVHRRRQFDDLCPLCYRYGSGKPDHAAETTQRPDTRSA